MRKNYKQTLDDNFPKNRALHQVFFLITLNFIVKFNSFTINLSWCIFIFD